MGSHNIDMAIDGADCEWSVARLAGREEVHAPFRFQLTCAASGDGGAGAKVIPADLLAKKAMITWTIAAGHERTIEGVVDQVVAYEGGYRIDVVSRLGVLADTADHRVFLDLDATEITEEVLADHGISLDVRVRRSLPKRAQCVQAFESDTAFVSRILAEEGIVWYPAHDRPDTLILCDDPSGHDPVERADKLPIREHGGLEAEDSIYHASLKTTLTQEKVTLRDYDFQKPKLDLSVETTAGSRPLEHYDFPGGYDDPALGKSLAEIRLASLRARRRVLVGETSCRALVPGYVIEAESPGRESMAGRWLVLDVEHEFEERGEMRAEAIYHARFRAVPAADGYRPPRPRVAGLGGVQTAMVTGPGGSEIHTEQHGRIKALLRWDRRRQADDKSSAWLRVMQPPTSGGFFLPRTGWEVLLGFSGRSLDVPIELGRLYNGTAPPPNGLPGDKVVSAFGTQTTPGGGSANLVAMNDTAGNESMSFVASKDYNERVEHDKAGQITANDSWTVGAARKLIVGQVHAVKVTGAQSYTVGGSRTLNTTSNYIIGAASETVMIGGARFFNVGGDYSTGCSSLTRLVGAAKAETAIEHVNRHVNGASSVLVGGSWNARGALHAAVKVAGANSEAVAGAKTIDAGKYELKVRGAMSESLASRTVTAGNARLEKFGAAGTYSIGGATTLEGSNVVIAADTCLTIRANGITIEITPGEVKIDGKFDGSVESVDEGSQEYTS